MGAVVRRGGSWLDWPRGYRPLLAMGRTLDCQRRIPEAEIAALEERYDRCPINPMQFVISTTQRLDLVATAILAEAMADVTSHRAKRDVLTVWKAKHRWEHEIPASNLTEAERRLPKVYQEFFDVLDGTVQ